MGILEGPLRAPTPTGVTTDYGQAVLAAGVTVPPSVQPCAPLIRMRPAEPPPPPPLIPLLPPT